MKKIKGFQVSKVIFDNFYLNINFEEKCEEGINYILFNLIFFFEYFIILDSIKLFHYYLK